MDNLFSRLLTKWFATSPARIDRNPRNGRAKGRVKRAVNFRPSIESLEGRVVPTSTWYQVDTLADGSPNSFTGIGAGTQNDPFRFSTLLGAVVNANTSHPATGFDTDTITFNPALFTNGARTISLLSQDTTAAATVDPTTTLPYNRGASDFVINTNIAIVGPNNIGPSGEYGLTLQNALVGNRLFYVDFKGSLTLENLTLTGGYVQGSNGGAGGGGGGAGMGGAIFNDGRLNLLASTLSGNTAVGGNGGAGWGTGGGLTFLPSHPTGTVLGGHGGSGSAGGGFAGVRNVYGVLIPVSTGGVGGAGGAGASYNNNNGMPIESNASVGNTGGIGGFGSGGGGGGGGGGNIIGTGAHGAPGGAGGHGGFGGGGGNGGGGGYNALPGTTIGSYVAPIKAFDGQGGAGGFGGGKGGGGAYLGGGGGAGMGGAIFNNGLGTVTITNCTLAGNSASGGAPGFANGAGTAGYGQGLGGAIFNVNGSLNIYDSTISGNTAAQGGAGVYALGYNATANVVVENSIVASPGGAAELKGAGPVNTFEVADLLDVDPKLGPLANNGGPTQTMMPLPGSPAIDAGDNRYVLFQLDTDQRGQFPRKFGSAADIGAVEFQPLNQTITFRPLAKQTLGDPPITLSATADSGLPVSYRIVAGGQYANLSGNVITFLQPTPPGTVVTVEATQAGNSFYKAASPVNQSFSIAKAVQTIDFDSVPDQAFGSAPFTVSATASSGLPVSFSVFQSRYVIYVQTLVGYSYLGQPIYQPMPQTVTVPTPYASISGNTITLLGMTPPGTSVMVEATQAGDANTAAAAPVVQSFTIGKANQSIDFGSIPNQTYGTPLPVDATASSGLPVSFSVFQSRQVIYVQTLVAYTPLGQPIYDLIPQTITIPTPYAAVSGNTITLLGATPPGTVVTVEATQAGDDSHNAAGAVDRTFTIGKASSTTTVVDASGPYSGSAFAATVTVSGAGTITGNATLDYFDVDRNIDLGSTAPINAGHYTVTATYAGDANHTGSSGSVAFTITRAASTTTTLGAGPFTYDGMPHSAGSGTVTGANGLNSSATSLTYSANPNGSGVADFINAGTYYVTAHFAGDANHPASDGNPIAIVIKPATASITITPYASAATHYDGHAHVAIGSAKGVNGEDLSANLNLNGTTHTNAGSYIDTWTFHDPKGNYKDVSGTINDVISQATPTVTVSGYTGGIYDGEGHTQTVTVAGVPGDGQLYTNTMGPIGKAGSYSQAWAFSSNPNYVPVNGALSFTVSQATPTVVVGGYTGDIYDGLGHTQTVTVTGVPGDGQIDTTTLSGGNAGDYSQAWAVNSNPNYVPVNGTLSFTIGQATPTVVVSGYMGGTYDGQGHTQTVTVTGVPGDGQIDITTLSGGKAGKYSQAWAFDSNPNYVPVNGTLSFTISQATPTVAVSGYTGGVYDGNARTQTVIVTGVPSDGQLDTTSLTSTNAGNFSQGWSLSSNPNYSAVSGNLSFNITQASSTTTVIDASGTYSGSAFRATATISGAGIITGAPSFYYFQATDTTFSQPLSGAPINAGSYVALAKYPGDANHTDSSGTVAFTITKASATVVVTPYSVTYDGAAHSATVSIKGVNGETGATVGVVTLNSTHAGAGTYSDSWSFTGGANYNSIATKTIADVITKAPLTIAVNNLTVIVGATPSFSATYSGFVAGQGPSSLTGTLIYSGAGKAVGSYTITANGQTSPNYAITYKSGKLNVTYGISPQFDSSKPVKSGTTLPIRIKLTNFAGSNVSSPNITVHADYLMRVGDPTQTHLPVQSAGNSGNNFKYANGSYQLNLKTTGLASGTYQLFFSVTGDPVEHSVTFTVV